VCRLSDVSPCNTKRPDSSGDATRCDGTGHDFPSTAHVGWLAQRAVSAGMSAGQLFSEDGVVSGTTTCESFPVWCCWE
jgi:hypothetical protein